MTKVLLTVFLFLGMSSFGSARELDDESSVTNRQIKGTMVLRVDKRTHKAEYVKTDDVMTSKEKAKKFAKTAKFKRVPASNIKSELDHDSGASSWYFYNNQYDGRYGRDGYDGRYNDGYNNGYYNNPYCNYYGNNYQSYYYYSNSNYNYYYYGNCYWNRGYNCGYY
ncbi:hypothetical protein [Bdellovibrio sp. HCB337]|uniref:hypothetical protein n=1 Tax=Bdellovibrio sp. HCB337 TaxID=3394358 RepID=UPI0039A62FCA